MRHLLASIAIGLVAAGSLLLSLGGAGAAGSEGIYPFSGPVPRANCGPGSLPEDGVQGEVTLADRNDGRSQLGYRCNLQLLGQYQGVGAGWMNTWYDHCDYYDTAQNTTAPGVQVVDVSDPTHPKATANLITPAMLGPWESLKVNQKRGLLAGVAAYDGAGNGPLMFDIYDVSKDCAHPTLLASVPFDVPIGHEGNWAPDGLTYYGSATFTGTYAAIDTTNPSLPQLVTVFHNPASPSSGGHGLSISDDGKTAYLVSPACGNGLEIADVSQVQARAVAPQVAHVGGICWTDGSTAQVPIPIRYHGRPYILFVDEGGGSDSGSGTSGVPGGAARIIDIGDPANPKIIASLRLEIQTDKYATLNQAEIAGNGIFGYEGHYCSVDRENDPTAAACGYFQSGIRVFDIRDPYHPREIAYYNPPAQELNKANLAGSEHVGQTEGHANNANASADWCSSPLRFYHAADGSWELWGQCQDNGFMALKFTNRVYPLGALPSSSNTAALAGRNSASSVTAYGVPEGTQAAAPAASATAVQPPTSSQPAPASGTRPASHAAPTAVSTQVAAYKTSAWLPLGVVLLWLLLLLNLGVAAGRKRI